MVASACSGLRAANSEARCWSQALDRVVSVTISSTPLRANDEVAARCSRWSPLFLDLWRSEQHACRPLSALIDPRPEQPDLVRCQRGESLPHSPGRHFRVGHLTGHVIDQRALLAVSGDNGRRPGCAALQDGVPAVDAEKAPRLFTAVTGGTGTLQERLDLVREIDCLRILRR